MVPMQRRSRVIELDKRVEEREAQHGLASSSSSDLSDSKAEHAFIKELQRQPYMMNADEYAHTYSDADARLL